jgi:large subunit ribosomal protein L4
VEHKLKNTNGEDIGSIELDDSVFGVPMNKGLVHQVMVAHRANARKGTAHTKTRGEVSGGGRKPRPQKGSGKSRQGSIRSPQWRGGGTVFGPRVRSYKQQTPKKMRRLAIRCMLSDKVSNDSLTIVDDLTIQSFSTKSVITTINQLGLPSSVLIATGDVTQGSESSELEQARINYRTLHRSARNIEQVRVTKASLLNVLDLMNYDHLLMTEGAIAKVQQLWSQAKTSVDLNEEES